MKRINLTKGTAAALGLGVMLAMAPLTMAQVAPPPGAAGAQTSTTASDPGSIDTSKPTTTTTTTTTTKIKNVKGPVVSGDTNTAPLPNTGGDPLLFVLAGSMLIAGGWILRRKMAQEAS